MIPLLVVLVLLVAAVFYAIATYNNLVGLRNRWKNAFSQIDVQLKRRYDLIPNLVETAKGYMAHEKGTLEAVIQARNTAAAACQRAATSQGDAAAMQGLAGAEGALTGVLTRFMALAEAYPTLQANENMKALMEELSSTENRIAFSRQAYNDAVMTYNTGIEVFPAIVVARMLSFQPASLFEVTEPAEKNAPKVSFS